jgi:hypothetical protein
MLKAVLLFLTSVVVALSQVPQINYSTVNYSLKFIDGFTSQPLVGKSVQVSAQLVEYKYLLDDPSGGNETFYGTQYYNSETVSGTTDLNGVASFSIQYRSRTLYSWPYGPPHYILSEIGVDHMNTPIISGYESVVLDCNNIWIATPVSQSSNNFTVIDIAKESINKTISNLFYSNGLALHYDDIKNQTGFELGAPKITSIACSTLTFSVPIYMINGATNYIGTVSFSLIPSVSSNKLIAIINQDTPLTVQGANLSTGQIEAVVYHFPKSKTLVLADNLTTSFSIPGSTGSISVQTVIASFNLLAPEKIRIVLSNSVN